MFELALLLADGRWPGGGYAHSGGLEAAVDDGSVGDATSLRSFVGGRLASIGVVEAWLAGSAAAAVWAAGGSCADARAALVGWQDECEARSPSPTLRAAGRSLGRGLRRTARQCWPAAGFPAEVEQYPVVLGMVAAVAGLDVEHAIRVSVHHSLFGPLNAAPKLLSIDMADVCALAVELAPLADAVADEALAAVGSDDPPCWSAPLVEQRAELHASWEVRLFAS